MKGMNDTPGPKSMPNARIWSLTKRNTYFSVEWLVSKLKQRRNKVNLDCLVVQESNIMPKTNGDILKGQRSWLTGPSTGLIWDDFSIIMNNDRNKLQH